MSSLTIKGFRFCVYSNDHNPAHVDVVKGRGTLKIYLSLGQGMPVMGPRKEMSDKDAAEAYQICRDSHGQLVTLWRSVHGEKESQ